MLNLYVETVAHLEPPTSNSVITLSIPPANSLQLLSGTIASRSGRSSKSPHPRNESTHVKQFLAGQGSIYFRRAKTYPRSFVWRVLQDNKILELRCADLARSEHEVDEAYLTVRLEVPDLILPGGIALSDVEGQNVLYIFLITFTKELHTLTVPLDFFRKAEASDVDRRMWCKTFVPSSFTIDTPHRLHAHTPFELFVALDSGRLQRLMRKAEDDGSYWIQDNFDDRSWGASLRGMVKWQSNQFIPFESRVLSQTTANAMVASSDSTYLYTICLNHTLRVWSLTTGKLVVSKDLLDRAIQSQSPHTILSPATPSFLRLFKAKMMDHSILVTYSPYNEGQFKFWDIRGGLTEPLSVADKFPDKILRPPDPDPSGNTIWSLSGFELRPGNVDESTELWVLWRNNNFSQVYSLHFDLEDLSEAWTTNWVKVQNSISPGASPPDFAKNDSRDTTGKWVDFLFWPHRYPTSVLETSLFIYEDAMQMEFASSGKDRPLQERLCASIASHIRLRKHSESEMDYTQFALDTDSEWRRYWQIAEGINTKRRSPISLVFDTYANMAWVLQADQYCGLRECNDLELVRYNTNQSLQHLDSITNVRWPHRKRLSEDDQLLQRMAQLLDIASSFGRSFSPELTMDCESALRSELLEEAEYPLPYRINDFYERCHFDDAISNETYEKVLHGLEAIGGLEIMGAELVPSILALLPAQVRGSHTALRSTIFGSNIVDAGLEDTITMGRQVVYDLFVLVIFLECEENQDENRSEQFDATNIFKIMRDILKEYERKIWLLSHVRYVLVEFSKHASLEHNLISSTLMENSPTQQVTLLRDTKGKDIKPQPAVGSPQSCLLTEMLNDIEVWVGGASEISSDDGCVWLECDLIAHGNIALASEFSRFQPTTPWSTYVKGRLCLARSEYEQAALYFQKAAYPLAHGKAIGMLSEMSAGLLTVEETYNFNSGSSRYFQHIVSLFESARKFSFAAEFSRLALAALPHDHPARAVQDQDNVLSRLFAAELRCCHYLQAYTTLTQLREEELQERSAIAWTDAILGRNSLPRVEATDCIRLLQRLPLDLRPHIARAVDDHLTRLAEEQALVAGSSSRNLANMRGADYLNILYALRLGRQDYRGAVSVLLKRLYLIKGSGPSRNDSRSTVLRHTLLALINALSCVAPDEAYIVAPVRGERTHPIDVETDREGRDLETGWKPRGRIIISLEDLRREYQQLLDQCSRIERGDFDFDAGSADESEESEAGTSGADSTEF